MSERAPRQLDDETSPYAEVTAEMARRISSATRHPDVVRHRRPEPDPNGLATALNDMVAEFCFRQVVDAMPTVEALSGTFEHLARTVEATRRALRGALRSADCLELLLLAGEDAPTVETCDGVQAAAGHLLNDLLPWLAARVRACNAALVAEGRARGVGRRLVLPGGDARHWLYAKAVPDTFKSQFGTDKYRVLSGDGFPAPGGRFTQAVFDETGLPGLALSTLDQYERERRRPGASAAEVQGSS